MQKVLVIDDDRDMCLLLQKFLKRHNYDVADFTNAKKALLWYEENMPDIVLCDLRLEDISGVEVMKKMKEKNSNLPFIIITGYSDVKTAVDIMKHGAFDYVTKPLFPDEILVTIKQALEEGENNKSQNVIIETTPLFDGKEQKTFTNNRYSFSKEYITGKSEAFQQIMQQIKLVAPTNYSVIIYGESGSGKEAIANEIHNQSKRVGKPFVAIDCGALSKELASSEMFGHEKGSFTGAMIQKVGSFELANGGTIFLDEVANLPYDVQVSLLRVVQERKMRRVGGTKDIELDVRIIVASNERLWDTSRRGKFREDLFHRFNEFSINLPPLRERKEDILIFAYHFLQLTNKELNKTITDFSKEVKNIFLNYVWYGNLRELKNVIKRAALLSDTDCIEVQTLPFEISNFHKLSPFREEESASTSNESYSRSDNDRASEVSSNKPKEFNLKAASIDAEYETIFATLKEVNFNKSKAAKLLNIDRKTLYNKIKEHQMINNK